MTGSSSTTTGGATDGSQGKRWKETTRAQHVNWIRPSSAYCKIEAKQTSENMKEYKFNDGKVISYTEPEEIFNALSTLWGEEDALSACDALSSEAAIKLLQDDPLKEVVQILPYGEDQTFMFLFQRDKTKDGLHYIGEYSGRLFGRKTPKQASLFLQFYEQERKAASIGVVDLSLNHNKEMITGYYMTKEFVQSNMSNLLEDIRRNCISINLGVVDTMWVCDVCIRESTV